METPLTKVTKCDATGKTRYYSQSEAKEALLRIKGRAALYDNITKKRYKRRQGKAEQCRYYYCKHCRGYHLTSSVAPLKQKTIEKQYHQRVKKTTGLVVSEKEASAWKADSLPFPDIKP